MEWVGWGTTTHGSVGRWVGWVGVRLEYDSTWVGGLGWVEVGWSTTAHGWIDGWVGLDWVGSDKVALGCDGQEARQAHGWVVGVGVGLECHNTWVWVGRWV